MTHPALNLAADEPTTLGLTGAPLTAAAITAAIVLALVVAEVVLRLVRATSRRWDLATSLSSRMTWPWRLMLVTIGVWVAVNLTTEPTSESSVWTSPFTHALFIVVVILGGWLLIQLVHVAEDGILARFSIDSPDNRHARRVHTQVQIIGRLLTAVIVVVAGAVILFTFPQMRAVGASVLASAGLVAIIAGVAAQSSLANMFAGMQVAFADAIRVDDVVVVEGEWGRIEEITLTYVVVHIWDERRLVLPSTYFTSNPFQNWTRESSQLLGTVELDVDWTVPLEDLREEMDRLLAETDLWDERVGIIQVTGATGGTIRLRALASAESGPIMWDLRCYLREGLVTWLQEAGVGLPRSRFESVGRGAAAQPLLPGEEEAPAQGMRERGAPPAADRTKPAVPASSHDTGLFTGTQKAVERSQQFSGPPPEVLQDRHKAAKRHRGEQERAYHPPPAPPPARPT